MVIVLSPDYHNSEECRFLVRFAQALQPGLITRHLSMLNLLLVRLQEGVKYCDEYVSLSLCPLTYLKNHMAELPQIFTSFPER